jgi:hypothetical protein
MPWLIRNMKTARYRLTTGLSDIRGLWSVGTRGDTSLDKAKGPLKSKSFTELRSEV